MSKKKATKKKAPAKKVASTPATPAPKTPKTPEILEKPAFQPPSLPRILSYGKRGGDVKRVQELLDAQGYFKGTPRGNFLDLTKSAVQAFQHAHLDGTGQYLYPDGVVGPKTWWALHNPSGDAQRSFITPTAPKEIEDGRREILQWFAEMHQQGIREIPDGSNNGDGVSPIIKATGIGPHPWCMSIQSYGEKKVFGEAPFQKMHAHVGNFWNEASKWGRAFRKEDYEPIPGDIAIWNYRNARAKTLRGAGHAARVATVSNRGEVFNTFGGNEGNRLKFGLRRTREASLVGFVNLFRDEENPPEFTKGVVHAPKFLLTERSSR